jgi:hypothetical protein
MNSPDRGEVWLEDYLSQELKHLSLKLSFIPDSFSRSIDRLS